MTTATDEPQATAEYEKPTKSDIFMVDPRALLAIADAGEIAPHDIILEVGPGVGNLTRLLSQRAKEGAVLAVDIDRKLLPAIPGTQIIAYVQIIQQLAYGL